MRVVIDIPEDVYTRLFDNGTQDNEIAVDDVCEMARVIRLGTPLPKGHGRIIDYGYVVDAIDDWINAGEYNYTNATEYLRKRIANTPTIIEAESEEERHIPISDRLPGKNVCTQRCCLKNHNIGTIECNEECSNRTLF